MSDQLNPIALPAVVTVRQLSELIGFNVAQIIKVLISYGVKATINESIDYETAAIVADELGVSVTPLVAQTIEVKSQDQVAANLVKRAPVITVMGHVDHGKTRLLDTIRQTNIVATEAGGITQHIGAYQVEVKTEDSTQKITFLDTPGHEAFSAMRAHGANITDIVVLVVAADDGIKPQTLEAISHARAAKVPIIVAITKIDKPEADQERIKRQLAELDLLPEEWGGKTPICPVSSVTKAGIPELLELIILTADILELQSDIAAPVKGVVIESHLAPGLGPVATVLITEGKLKVATNLVFRSTYGKVRSMDNFLGKKQTEAIPGTPVRIAGLRSVPEFGETFQQVADDKIAREMIEQSGARANVKSIRQLGLGQLSQDISAGELKELTVIVKADTQGSLEAIANSLNELGTSEVSIKIVHQAVGDVNESDINMAVASQAIVVAFNVNAAAPVRKFATQKSVKISSYSIIYQLIDDLYSALSGLLEPEIVEVDLGQLEVLAIFKDSKKDSIVGGRVVAGAVEKLASVRIKRNGQVVGLAKVKRVQREKELVEKVVAGTECGLMLDSDTPIKVGDKLDFFKQEEHIRKLEKKSS